MHIFSHSKKSEKDYTLYAIVFLVAMVARIFFLIWIDEPILFFKYPYFAEKLVQQAVTNNWGLFELIPQNSSLEEIFVELTTSEDSPQETDSATLEVSAA